MSTSLYGIVFASVVIRLPVRFRHLFFLPGTVSSDQSSGNDDTKARRISAGTNLERSYFQDCFRSIAIDIMYDMAKAPMSVTAMLQASREQRKLLEASMRDVEMWLLSRYKGSDIVTGSLLNEVQREANLEVNEANFVRAQHALHCGIAQVQIYLQKLREITTQVRTWMASGVSAEVQDEAYKHIGEIEAESNSVMASLNTILCEVDREPVGISAECISDESHVECSHADRIASVVGDWRKERAEARSKIRLQ